MLDHFIVGFFFNLEGASEKYMINDFFLQNDVGTISGSFQRQRGQRNRIECAFDQDGRGAM